MEYGNKELQTKMNANTVYGCIFERNANFYVSCLEMPALKHFIYHQKCSFLNKLYYIISHYNEKYKQIKTVCKTKYTYIHDR